MIISLYHHDTIFILHATDEGIIRQQTHYNIARGEFTLLAKGGEYFVFRTKIGNVSTMDILLPLSDKSAIAQETIWVVLGTFQMTTLIQIFLLVAWNTCLFLTLWKKLWTNCHIMFKVGQSTRKNPFSVLPGTHWSVIWVLPKYVCGNITVHWTVNLKVWTTQN